MNHNCLRLKRNHKLSLPKLDSTHSSYPCHKNPGFKVGPRGLLASNNLLTHNNNNNNSNNNNNNANNNNNNNTFI